MVPTCPAEAVGCSDVGTLGPDMVWVFVILGAVVFGFGVFVALKRR